mmetsp:Transcript_7276/g.10421  ORF Transcript_7276/g.10421 Transcript_7276/m.10421 type:complete len:380 (-) Transcript_7276:46-1185(-)|eukprot:CAMPEP_0184869276 /NCGR_PEP_ID=MMETSP0580-20130426/33493_1 /TAXON_ID=1118495 /ORGANISM="Dactyliosolen fragilissimus" /LENGTH=379 /DNA_ID=CAMNT_0027370651 /DNA_START=32 /DNA_END=1171 /DNA_ORIENTATION=-
MELFLIFHFFWLLYSSSVFADSSATGHEDLIQLLVNWVENNGGFVSKKIAIRRINATDVNSPFGVYAKEYIEKGEIILNVPQTCYISLPDQDRIAYLRTADDMDHQTFSEVQCVLAHVLMKELELGSKSRFAPFIAYLNTQNSGQLPAMWSEPGKNALRKLIIPGTDIVDWIDQYYKSRGCIKPEDEVGAHAIEMTIQRGYDTALIPLLDMFNHDNKLLNTENTSIQSPDGVSVTASIGIEADEEIYQTYDMCSDCGDTQDVWGTPEILRDFGFVERNNQRWIFEEGDLWINLSFDEQTGDVDVLVEPYENERIIGDTDVRFLEVELKRLESATDDVLSDQGSVPQTEWDAILQFVEASTNALKVTIGYLKEEIFESEF